MTRAELIDRYVQEFQRHRDEGVEEWVTYARVDEDMARVIIGAALEAVLRIDEKVWVDRVPAHEDSPVQTLPDTVVIRFGNFPPLWATQ